MEKNNDLAGRWVDDRLAALKTDVKWEPSVHRGFARLLELRDAELGRGRAPMWVWLAAAAGATGLSLMAFPVTREFAHDCVSACVAESSKLREFFIREAPGTTPSAVYVKPEHRKMAPDFALNDAAGEPVKLSNFRGQVVLLNFWATWCSPCKVEIPWFVEFQRTYRDRDFTVLGVSLDEGGWGAVKPYLDDKQINYRVVVGSEDITRLYGGLDALPTTLIIDKSGRIAAIHVGLCSKREYEADVETVLNEERKEPI